MGNESRESYIDVLTEQSCDCPGSISDNFLQPCTLLLLHREPRHGYALIDALKCYGVAPDASVLYRALRRMEKEGLVESDWDTGGAGAARRIYRLSSGGEEYLHIWAATVEQNKAQLEDFLREYREAFQGPPAKASSKESGPAS
ncbi:MAG: helix-turn-helix transcriptional regulator [Nitrospinota bacterium]